MINKKQFLAPNYGKIKNITHPTTLSYGNGRQFFPWRVMFKLSRFASLWLASRVFMIHLDWSACRKRPLLTEHFIWIKIILVFCWENQYRYQTKIHFSSPCKPQGILLARIPADLRCPTCNTNSCTLCIICVSVISNAAIISRRFFPSYI